MCLSVQPSCLGGKFICSGAQLPSKHLHLEQQVTLSPSHAPALPAHCPRQLPCAWGGNHQQKHPVGCAGMEEGSAGANGPLGKLWAQAVLLLMYLD